MTETVFFNLTLELVLNFIVRIALIGGSAGALVAVLTNLVKMVVIWLAKRYRYTVPDQLFGKIVYFVNLAVIIVLFFVLGEMPTEVLPEDVDKWLQAITAILTIGLTMLPANQAALTTHKQMVSFAPTWFSVSGRQYATQYGPLATSDAIPSEVKAEIVAKGDVRPLPVPTRPT